MASSINVVHVGPWGGRGGHPWDFRTNGGKIKTIRITSDGSTINSIEFGYTDKDGKTHHAGPFGIPHTHHDDVDLNEISGTFGMWANMIVVTSLTFKTNKEVYGPFGSESSATFSLPVKGKFEGFFGRSGDVIDGFGAVLRA
ncbi:hypothetical protein E3N88_12773 [Mikania micrantha]|uniref:Jacalin-type lectin domain-containing protein n=1 Tax=Mikania micrantha TaxID=192012 RepID=A0A5N6P8I1_9ASTR|nr:hypothetical protein E3N88_12773 [Mikania micrantha]